MKDLAGPVKGRIMSVTDEQIEAYWEQIRTNSSAETFDDPDEMQDEIDERR